MHISIPLQAMSVEEKLQAMETIWDDLCARAEQIPSPAWHGTMLAERAAAVERGEEGFEDWETVKQNLNKLLR
ncbi:addiction module protein [Candidatus Thiosymbion oneisti]|uniref:addiction module protein n=1 Tax=Candidatus Thiosymbion oneisti TaxID=589554 RepID=UPI00105D5EC6|nr:addiction module protein [Candidatus Thiosymbion oneisti]